jgi:hypothetical protein
MTGNQAVANVGEESAHQYTKWETKANFTFFGTVTAEGTNSPLILLANGKTQRCHKQLSVHSIDNKVCNYASRWCTDNLMILSLKWMHKMADGEPIFQLINQYTAHVTDAVIFPARELGIYLIWIPVRYQPIAKRIFGALKSKRKATWQRQFIEHFGGRCAKDTAAELLLPSWDELRKSVVTAGWDFADPDLEGDEESDPMDEGFRLKIAQSSEDEDIRETRAEIPEDYDEEEE